ncbi:MAG: serine/threonine protein kinase, partial [Chloroflexi bacterium]|nr:serine/threonine protein kinase [Chloroflexota bacterium]
MAEDPLFADRYRLDAMLGQGGFKTVWRAHDTRLGRDVALAVYRVPARDTDSRVPLQREARALAALGEHPCIVTVHDQGEATGTPYLVMRLMTGGTLAALLDAQTDRRLPTERAVTIIHDVLSALAAAHTAGITHRDVKPSNIWLDDNGRA